MKKEIRKLGSHISDQLGGLRECLVRRLNVRQATYLGLSGLSLVCFWAAFSPQHSKNTLSFSETENLSAMPFVAKLDNSNFSPVSLPQKGISLSRVQTRANAFFLGAGVGQPTGKKASHLTRKMKNSSFAKQSPKKEAEQNKLSLALNSDFSRHVRQVKERFLTEQKKPLPIHPEKKLVYKGGKIHHSLVKTARHAGLDQHVVRQLLDIFGRDMNVASDLRPNDHFRLLLEEKKNPTKPTKTIHIVAAELVKKGKKYQAVRYTDRKTGKTGYFSPDGYGTQKAFLSAPLNFRRISSPFGERRHPVLHKVRPHKGVDYSAPIGTPVVATGDARVIFKGLRRGYGKVVELQHGQRYTSMYAHLSRFSSKVALGSTVKQGEVIGYVGRTGLSTGAHLHYEFRIDGIHKNPLTLLLPRKTPIQMNKHHFLAHAKEMLRLLDNHAELSLARTTPRQDSAAY